MYIMDVYCIDEYMCGIILVHYHGLLIWLTYSNPQLTIKYFKGLWRVQSDLKTKSKNGFYTIFM